MRKIAPTLLFFVALAGMPAQAQEKERELIQNSLTVLSEVQAMPDLQVPDWLLQKAEGIAILPEVVKAGAFIGGRGGTGVMLTRHRDGSWSNPLFIGIGAGSFGLQFGVQAADIVLVFRASRASATARSPSAAMPPQWPGRSAGRRQPRPASRSMLRSTPTRAPRGFLPESPSRGA